MQIVNAPDQRGIQNPVKDLRQLFAEIVNDSRLLTIFVKCFILDVSQGFKYAVDGFYMGTILVIEPLRFLQTSISYRSFY